MRQVTMVARTKAEYEELVAAPMIERPINQHWGRYIPPQMVAIGEDIAVIPEETDIVIRREQHRAVRQVRITYVYRDERVIRFYMKSN